MFNLFNKTRNLEDILREAKLTMNLYERLNEIQKKREEYYRTSFDNPTEIAIKELNSLVEFFGIMSEVYDNRDLLRKLEQGLKRRKYESLAELIRKFNLHLENCGRDEFGMNRTREGEQVTEDDVYVGGKFGLNTLPVSKWKNGNKSKEVCYGLAATVDIFLNSHIDPLKNTIQGIYNHLKENKYVVIEKKDKKTGETYFEIKKKKK